MVDSQGVPLAITLSAANVHDSQGILETIDSIPFGWHPEALYADKAYDAGWIRDALNSRMIEDRIPRQGVDSNKLYTRIRWVVERTFSWLNRFRRLKVRYERRADIHQAFLVLGCSLICWNYRERWFC